MCWTESLFIIHEHRSKEVWETKDETAFCTWYCQSSFGGVILGGAVTWAPASAPPLAPACSFRNRHFCWGRFVHGCRFHFFLSSYSTFLLTKVKKENATFHRTAKCRALPWSLAQGPFVRLLEANVKKKKQTLMRRWIDPAAAFSSGTSDCAGVGRCFWWQFCTLIWLFGFAPRRRRRSSGSCCKSRMEKKR